MRLETRTNSPAPLSALFNDKRIHRKVRRREGGFKIIDAQPGDPQTVRAVCYSLGVGQAVVFELGWAEHIAKCRSLLYTDHKGGGTVHFVTRAKGRYLVVMRVE
jgi:hypothetical protein